MVNAPLAPAHSFVQWRREPRPRPDGNDWLTKKQVRPVELTNRMRLRFPFALSPVTLCRAVFANHSVDQPSTGDRCLRDHHKPSHLGWYCDWRRVHPWLVSVPMKSFRCAFHLGLSGPLKFVCCEQSLSINTALTDQPNLVANQVSRGR